MDIVCVRVCRIDRARRGGGRRGNEHRWGRGSRWVGGGVGFSGWSLTSSWSVGRGRVGR